MSFSRAVLLGTLALGCASTPATDDVAPPALGVNPGRSWVATLRGLGSPIIGEIRISPAGSREMRAAISITGSDSGEEHPWHIHRGTCQSMVANAPVEGDVVSYRPVRMRGDGMGEMTVTLPIVLETGPYYVDVHRSRSNLDMVLACGTLSPEVE